jgi:Protein of unknown function (DUF4239)
LRRRLSQTECLIVIRAILNAVPAYALLLLVVALTLAVVVLAVWLVRRVVPATREGFHAEVSAPMLSTVAALFGLLLAFVIIIAYQNYLSAGADVSREADSMASIVRDSAAFPPRDSVRVRGAVGEYARAVTDDEWPQMRNGRSSVAASRALGGVVAALQATQPRSPAARGFYNDSVSQLNGALVARRDRLEAAQGGLPWELTALILFSALVILGYALLVGSPHFWFHALGPVAIGVVVAFSLVVLLDLSYPFSGDVTISPRPYKTGVLAQFFQSSR